VTASALPTLEIGPFDVPLGRPLQATARGRISRAGYGFEVEGEAELARLLNTARALGLFNFQITPKGLAKVDLKLASQWQDSVPRRVLGTVHVRSVRAEVPGLNAPLEIASANVTLAENEIKIQKISASLVDNAVSGSIVLARPCVTLAKCSARFDLHADEIASDRLRLLLTDTRPWYSFLSSSSRQAGLAYLAALHAAGRFTVARLSLPKIEATRLSATLELENRKLRLSNLRGEVLDGIHTGDWNIDFTGKGPVYKGQGTFERVSLEEIATVTGSNWITGTAAALYNVTASGSSTAELLSSAAGSVQLEARDGSLPHLVLASASNPLVVNRFVGEFLLRNGSFEIQQGKLETPAGIYLLSGTASLKRSLDLKLMRDSMHGFNITGTLPELQVQPLTLTETQAALNP
jgi:hypothetical protein